ncbi:hypothetical protein L6R52_10640, partial [Myxococcota bacterium]|nr:hypothetical protein [Myxococcota bacterium]
LAHETPDRATTALAVAIRAAGDHFEVLAVLDRPPGAAGPPPSEAARRFLTAARRCAAPLFAKVQPTPALARAELRAIYRVRRTGDEREETSEPPSAQR